MNIIAIGAHPDDIEYGCGGALLKWAKDPKNEIYIFVATNGEFGKNGVDRKQEQLKAAEIMGVKRIFWGGYRDTAIPMHQKLISDLENIMHIVHADYIFVHYYDDTHQDHRTLSQCTITAGRYIRNFLFYEGPTTQNFNPNIFVDIEPVMEEKKKLLDAHHSQITKTNIRNLNIMEMAHSNVNFRGIQARIKYAESFLSQRLTLDLNFSSEVKSVGKKQTKK